MSYDAAVVGLGAIGAAALLALARRGNTVIGLDRFEPGHARGSSHGETRMIRLGYFEHPSYVPLLREAYRGWRDLEAQSGHSLLTITGIVETGAPDSELVRGTLASSRLHGLPHEILDAATLMQRYPAFRVPGDFVAVYQPDGGYLAAAQAVEAMLRLARAAGADVRTNARVQAVEPRAGSARLMLDGDMVEAGAVVLAAGAWIKTFVPSLPVRTTRQVMAWIRPRDPALFARERFPVFLLESRHGVHYGFPLLGETVKVAKHHHLDQTVDPDHVDGEVSQADETAIRSAIAEFLPAADGALAAAKTCLYTVAPDHDFIIDALPGHPQMIVASACSGHGFKFAPVIGKIIADLATSGATPHDIARFRLGRFG